MTLHVMLPCVCVRVCECVCACVCVCVCVLNMLAEGLIIHAGTWIPKAFSRPGSDSAALPSSPAAPQGRTRFADEPPLASQAAQPDLKEKQNGPLPSRKAPPETFTALPSLPVPGPIAGAACSFCVCPLGPCIALAILVQSAPLFPPPPPPPRPCPVPTFFTPSPPANPKQLNLSHLTPWTPLCAHGHLATDHMPAATVHEHLPYMLHDMIWSAADPLLPMASASSTSKTSPASAGAPVSHGVGKGMKASGLLVVRQQMSQGRQMPQSSCGSGMALMTLVMF